jgi:2',3'-cyclic-nucleotide 2'-phosphodiesterase (5'-nucleotidase family)
MVSPSSRPAPRGPRLRVVSVNDVYSLENLPRLATLIRHYASTDPADAFIAVLAGDFVGPSMLSSLDRGQGMVACLNAAGITHVIFGNHEDDIPTPELQARVREYAGTWLSTNIRGFDPELPAFQVLPVAQAGGRTVSVGLVGVVMTDAAVYRRAPFGGLPLEPANDAVLREAARLRHEERCALVIPITHQSMADDHALIERAAGAGFAPFPVILGGHEHDIHIENLGTTWLVKAGIDAVQAAIVEFEWTAEASEAPPEVTVRLEPVAGFEEDAALRTLVDFHMAKVHELESAVLLPLSEGDRLSSVGSRARQTSLGTLVCSRARDVLDADLALLNGGGIRASRNYEHHLAYGDIKAELPFENEMVVARLPGRVILDAVAFSRSHAPAEHGGFLQVDDGVVVDATSNQVIAIGGAPLDLDREYRVALVRAFFSGMDHIQPFVDYAVAHPDVVPHAGSGRELKELLVEALSLALYRRLGSFEALDTDHDGTVTEADVTAAIAHVTSEQASPVTVALVMNAIDKDHDHRISKEESDAVNKP